MDRSYKAEDTVHVHRGALDGELLSTFKQAPYSNYGWDYYRFEGGYFPGYQRRSDGYVYILVEVTNLKRSVK